jgi:hypothetical protein
MSLDDAKQNWTGRILGSFAVVLVVAGGLWLFNKESSHAQPATAVATSCSGFAADAHKLFDAGEGAALRGTFAPGDQVHLAIDLNGVGYSWELTGVLGKKPNVTGSGWFDSFARHRSMSTRSITSNASTVSRGEISGYAKLHVEVDVATAGEGAIAIKSNASSLSLPRVASASCSAAQEPHPLERG